MNSSEINPNIISFVALANEYCQALEQAPETPVSDFVDTMLRLLPRLYIAGRDIPAPVDELGGFGGTAIYGALEEDQYEAVRTGVARLLGEDDMFLDAQVADMQYSDTPIAQSVAEKLADLYQPMYDLVYSVRESGAEHITEQATETRASIEQWSQPLTTALRVLNSLSYTLPEESE